MRGTADPIAHHELRTRSLSRTLKQRGASDSRSTGAAVSGESVMKHERAFKCSTSVSSSARVCVCFFLHGLKLDCRCFHLRARDQICFQSTHCSLLHYRRQVDVCVVWCCPFAESTHAKHKWSMKNDTIRVWRGWVNQMLTGRLEDVNTVFSFVFFLLHLQSQ